MIIPNFEALELLKESRHKYRSQALSVHQNPRFYKYYWWVFRGESPVDGKEFLTDKYRINTAAALKLVNDLQARGEPYCLYNCQLPRRDPANPFDGSQLRWKGAEWAVALDEDPDPFAPEPYAGHK